jgi:hypothetical protein
LRGQSPLFQPSWRQSRCGSVRAVHGQSSHTWVRLLKSGSR